jgi:hypothetical protein
MRLRDLFIALSLANLCYLRVWSELLTYTRSDTYLMKMPPAPAHYLAVMLNVLLVAGALGAAVTLARRKASKSGFRWPPHGSGAIPNWSLMGKAAQRMGAIYREVLA